MNRSGMLARLLDLDIVSNNLANFNTIGFKASRSNFQELLTVAEAVVNPTGVQLRSTQRLTSQGALKESENPLDLAISGEGLFAVTLPDGRTAYTRDGQFTLDAARNIVTASGYPLVWEGALPEDAADIHVNPDGAVMVLQGDTWAQVGTIALSRFANPDGLQGIGQNLWLETEVSGQVQTGAPGSELFGPILGNALEQSNVNLASEMTRLISLQRSFELSLRSFQSTDEMISQAIHMRR